MVTPLDDAYFTWLASKVVVSDRPSQSYWPLLRIFYEYEYEWSVQGDHNRAEDGLDLRNDFLIETGHENDDNWFSVGVSVLEVLVAFGYRAEWQTDISAPEWFWIIINNLGLRDCDENDFDPEYVEEILYSFVWRTYNSDGSNGGLFPLNNPQHDQREVEIWYQFSEYLAEHEEIGM